jgi:hypothetical protein
MKTKEGAILPQHEIRFGGRQKVRKMTCLSWPLAACLLAAMSSGGRAQPVTGSSHSADFYKQWAVQVTRGHSQSVSVGFDLEDPAVAAELTARGASDDGRLVVALKRYLPDARISAVAEPDPDGKAGPAVHLILNVAGQEMDRWLASDEPDYGSLLEPTPLDYVRLSGDRTVKDELEYLEILASPMPALVVRKPVGGERPAAYRLWEDQELPLGGGDVKVRVKRLASDFYIDKETGAAGTRSSDLKNPAAILEVESGGKIEKVILFSLYPGFSKNATNSAGVMALHWQKRDEKPRLERMVLVDSDSGGLTLLVTEGARVRTLDVRAGQPVPLLGQTVSMKLIERLAAARMRVVAENASNSLRRPAVLAEVIVDGTPAQQVWVTVGTSAARGSGEKEFRIQLGPRTAEPKNGPVVGDKRSESAQ